MLEQRDGLLESDITPLELSNDGLESGERSLEGVGIFAWVRFGWLTHHQLR